MSNQPKNHGLKSIYAEIKHNLGDPKPFTSKENNDKIQQYQTNPDPKLKEKIVLGNIALVFPFVEQYKGNCKSLTEEDLTSIGLMALMEAIEKFDPNRGFTFATYATDCIKGKILRAIADTDKQIRLPANVEDKLGLIKKAIRDLRMDLGREPTVEEIANKVGFSPKKVDELLNVLAQQQFINIFDTIVDDSQCYEIPIEELIPAEDYGGMSYEEFDKSNDSLLMFAGLKKLLTPIQYYILFYNVLSKPSVSCEELGMTLKISNPRASQIKRQAQAKIKEYATLGEGINLESQNIKAEEVNINPILPREVLWYLYIKEELTESERKLMHFRLFSIFKPSTPIAARELGWTESDVIEIAHSVKAKLKEKFSDKEAFETYSEKMLSEYAGEIYKLIEESPQPLRGKRPRQR